MPPGALGFITLWPQGTAQPQTSTLNAIDGAITSNMAIVSCKVCERGPELAQFSRTAAFRFELHCYVGSLYIIMSKVDPGWMIPFGQY